MHSFFGRVKIIFSGLFLQELQRLRLYTQQDMLLFKKNITSNLSFVRYVPGHYSDVTLGDTEKIINNDFIQLRAK